VKNLVDCHQPLQSTIFTKPNTGEQSMPTNLQQQKAELIAAAKTLYNKNLVAAHAGNLSVRLPDDNILITAANRSKGRLQPTDILLLDPAGNLLEAESNNKPTSELALHLALYQTNPQIKAIVHAHPPYATALACSNLPFNWQLLEEARLLLGPVPTIPYYTAGSAYLAQAVATAAAGNSALLLANHGVVCWGEALEQALFRMEALEHTAQVMAYRPLFR
jgi:L-fuculose-phosphate aldolase